jgi:hypothetical protein
MRRAGRVLHHRLPCIEIREKVLQTFVFLHCYNKIDGNGDSRVGTFVGDDGVGGFRREQQDIALARVQVDGHRVKLLDFSQDFRFDHAFLEDVRRKLVWRVIVHEGDPARTLWFLEVIDEANVGLLVAMRVNFLVALRDRSPSSGKIDVDLLMIDPKHFYVLGNRVRKPLEQGFETRVIVQRFMAFDVACPRLAWPWFAGVGCHGENGLDHRCPLLGLDRDGISVEREGKQIDDFWHASSR